LPDHQPILEAGCGSGRWVGWFIRKGWQATGLDWSEACCERARSAIPEARFMSGDMRDMPFADNEFGSIVSLGAVEHSAEGPLRSLQEYRRVLRPGGIAIITVPYLSIMRRCNRFVTAPKNALVRNSTLRRLLGKTVGRRKLGEARKEIMSGYAADYFLTDNGVDFYQYQFSKSQMRPFLHEAGFEVMEEFVDFGDEGILHNFGRLSGFYDHDGSKVSFTLIGKMLRLLPVNLMGHMLCYLVRKPSIYIKQ